MKRFLVVTFLVVAAAVGYRFYGSPETGTGNLTLPQPSPNPTDSAPRFEADERDGGEFELSGDGVYVVTFWSTLNQDTAEARPVFDRLAREYEDEGVSFAAVYVSYAPEGQSETPYSVLQDGSGELASLYNVKRVPRLFLVNDGVIELVQNGFYGESEDQLEEELDRLLEQQT